MPKREKDFCVHFRVFLMNTQICGQLLMNLLMQPEDEKT